MNPTPPPLPPQSNPPPPRRTNDPALPGADAAYNMVADKIGGVPNLRKKDNLYQGLCVLAFLVIGVIGGYVWRGGEGALLGALAGLIAGLLLSGAVLMVIGLIRKS